MTLGTRLSKLRQQKGQSLQRVADAVGVSKAHIWDLEKERTANPSMGLVTKLADHFEVSIASLLGEDAPGNDADGRLARIFRQAAKLPPADLVFLEAIVEFLVAGKHRS
jgi:transcriptional regulator with XRE-family HTH domain